MASTIGEHLYESRIQCNIENPVNTAHYINTETSSNTNVEHPSNTETPVNADAKQQCNTETTSNTDSEHALNTETSNVEQPNITGQYINTEASSNANAEHLRNTETSNTNAEHASNAQQYINTETSSNTNTDNRNTAQQYINTDTSSNTNTDNRNTAQQYINTDTSSNTNTDNRNTDQQYINTDISSNTNTDNRNTAQQYINTDTSSNTNADKLEYTNSKVSSKANTNHPKNTETLNNASAEDHSKEYINSTNCNTGKNNIVKKLSNPVSQIDKNSNMSSENNGNSDKYVNSNRNEIDTADASADGDIIYTYNLEIVKNPFTDNLGISGKCTFTLGKKSASLQQTSGLTKSFTWYYKHIRQYGTREGCFFMEVGRRCVTGEGSLLLSVIEKLGQEIVRNMKRLIEKMSLEFFLKDKVAGSINLAEEEFIGEIVKTKFSKQLKLSGRCALVVGVTGLSLQTVDTDKMLYWWPFKNLRQYTAKETKFMFEGGRSSMAGEGAIEMKMIAGPQILGRLQHFKNLIAIKKEILAASEAAKGKTGQSAHYQGLLFNKDDKIESQNHTYQELGNNTFHTAT